MISYGIFETARNGGLFCVVRITFRRYGKWKNSEKSITRVNGKREILCHIGVRKNFPVRPMKRISRPIPRIYVSTFNYH